MNNTTQQYCVALRTAIRRVGWIPLSVLAAHEVCSKVINGYARWPWIDIPLHLLGGVAIAIFASGLVLALVEHAVILRPEWIVHASLVFTAGCTAAVFWEFAEWIADHTIGTNCQMNDLNDTMLDLAVGVVGAMLVAISVLVLSARPRSANPH